MARKGTPTVIIRKDKRLHKGAHLAAFVLTGGASGVYTATKAATNAGYNARTRQLQAEAEDGTEVRVTTPSTARDRLQDRSDAARQARHELDVEGVPWRKLTREQKEAIHLRADQLIARQR